MPFFDLPPDRLRDYRPPSPEAADFDAFWEATLADARRHEVALELEPADVAARTAEVYDATFRGFGGDPIRGWLLLPRGIDGPLPGVVEYIGYGGGRGTPYSWTKWVTAGFATLVMDTRGQGSASSPGATPDPQGGSHPHHPGFVTLGVRDPETYYYRRLFTDAVRAVDALRSHPRVDGARVAAVGGSQGGAIAVAVAGLVPDLGACVPDVPFLCDVQRAVGIAGMGPYHELVHYLRVHRDREEETFRTLSYFDGICFARRSSAPACWSTGLMDIICPPSGVYAAFNHLATDEGDRELHAYRFCGHEAGGEQHQLTRIRWLAERWYGAA